MLNKNFAVLVTNMLAPNSTGPYGLGQFTRTDITGTEITNGNQDGCKAGSILGSLLNGLNNKKKFSEIANQQIAGATFAFGSSTEDEAYNQHALTSIIDDTNFSIVSASATNDHQKVVISQIWEYTGSDTITINEIGFFSNSYTTSASSSSYKTFMYDRTKLTSPITVDSEHTTFTIALTIGGKATAQLNS